MANQWSLLDGPIDRTPATGWHAGILRENGHLQRSTVTVHTGWDDAWRSLAGLVGQWPGQNAVITRYQPDGAGGWVMRETEYELAGRRWVPCAYRGPCRIRFTDRPTQGRVAA